MGFELITILARAPAYVPLSYISPKGIYVLREGAYTSSSKGMETPNEPPNLPPRHKRSLPGFAGKASARGGVGLTDQENNMDEKEKTVWMNYGV